ncbi:HlyD family secretion protein [Legionella sp. km772]|uniref:HlyD family secretion protein n=1 Tax=Legionella sp. km772 TaxID=2498111 RepID=UPI000F8E0614|nr:HlyD family efflux transporter periplasmic adaptor subunit [Legionella sp. km772]RUR12932.1 HlyD family efflux transporter periplasmic adaptor subunit [Legionella sp. km772]
MRSIILCCLIALLCSCNDNISDRYNGYIDADLVYITSSFPGRLKELLVTRGERVNKNQLLFKVEQTSDDFFISMSELTQANIKEQKAELINQLNYDETNYQRILKMHREDAASQNDLELARRDIAVLKNKLAAIDAQLKSNEINTESKRWERSRKEGFAQQRGLIFDTYFTTEEYVQTGQPILSLLTPEHIKIIFFIPEEKLKAIRLNNKIKFYSGEQVLGEGVINYISKVAQYTPPIIYSREDSYNLVFRVEARLQNPDLTQIHLGQPVNLEVVA